MKTTPKWEGEIPHHITKVVLEQESKELPKHWIYEAAAPWDNSVTIRVDTDRGLYIKETQIS